MHKWKRNKLAILFRLSAADILIQCETKIKRLFKHIPYVQKYNSHIKKKKKKTDDLLLIHTNVYIIIIIFSFYFFDNSNVLLRPASLLVSLHIDLYKMPTHSFRVFSSCLWPSAGPISPVDPSCRNVLRYVFTLYLRKRSDNF